MPESEMDVNFVQKLPSFCGVGFARFEIGCNSGVEDARAGAVGHDCVNESDKRSLLGFFALEAAALVTFHGFESFSKFAQSEKWDVVVREARNERFAVADVLQAGFVEAQRYRGEAAIHVVNVAEGLRRPEAFGDGGGYNAPRGLG